MKKALVTGSSKGLGLAIAKRLSTEGMSIAIGARSEDFLKKAVDELRNYSANIVSHTVDFSNTSDVDNYMSKSLSELGGIDILVNNVGNYMEDLPDGDIEINLTKSLELNLMAAVRVNKHVLKKMKSQKKGMIINIISIAANNLRKEAASYTISKVALQAYCKMLRSELKEYGIRVVNIYPGTMDTSSWEGVDVDHSKLIQMNEMTDLIMSAINMGGNANLDEITIDTLKDL